MSRDDLAAELAHECPRKILGILHLRGLYVHGTSARFPGKILCFHRDTPRPPDWTPTPAQQAAGLANGEPSGVSDRSLPTTPRPEAG